MSATAPLADTSPETPAIDPGPMVAPPSEVSATPPTPSEVPLIVRIGRQFRRLINPTIPRQLSERTRKWFAGVPILWLLLLAALSWMALGVYTSDGDLVTYFSSVLTVEYSHRFYAFLLDYPPGWVETSSLLGWGWSVFFPASSIFQPGALPAPTFVLEEKALLLAFDLLAGLAVFQLVLERSGDQGWAKLTLAAWLFNPLVLFEGAVHGAYDVIPAALTVMAFYLTIHHRFLAAGAALALGIWFKEFPLFFLPVLIVVLWQVVNRIPKDFLKAAALAAAGIGGVTAAVLWPPGLFQAWMASLPSGVINTFGGIGIWSFLSLPWFASAATWLRLNSSLIQDALYVLVSGLVAFLSVRLLRNMTAGPNTPATHHALLATGFVAPLAAVTVHPQYLVWAMPFLALVLWERREYLVSYAGISGGLTLYQLLAHDGPLTWFAALPVDTRLVTPLTLVRSINFWQPWEILIVPLILIPLSILLLLTLIHSFQLVRPLRQT